MITVSTKYALTALLYLAADKSGDFISIDTLASQTDVPAPYLAKLMKSLVRKKIVFSKKGFGGGFKLDRKRKGLTLYDVCVALDDPVVQNICLLGRRECSNIKSCIFHLRWGEMKRQIVKFTHDFKIT